MCEQQYFLQYVLGWQSPSNKKADKGTICHKVLEILAGIKLSQQNSKTIYNDDILGEIDTNEYVLSDITEKIYKYYSAQFKHHKWESVDFKDCTKWINKAITEYNGNFDPRSRDIVQPEQHFDIEIKKPWAKYEYKLTNGEILSGYLAIKGTIDLITRVNHNTFEIIDWKTGKRLDWATGEEKTLSKLYKDPQLKMYHYAASMLFPDIDHFIVSINFINDGGAFSICFEKNDLPDTENMLRKKFEIIKSTQRPKLNKTWKCNKLCHYGQTTFENTKISPIIEYRDNQTTPYGKNMSKCEQIKHEIDLKGMKSVVDECTAPGYTIGKYKAPGKTE